jgi:glycolate oxidase iron-sulfur subunit
LRNIPELKLEPINAPSRCCGAAGLYMMEHPQRSAELGKQVLKASGTGTITSSNIGCRLHLQSLQPERCLLHPISILAESLGLPK